MKQVTITQNGNQRREYFSDEKELQKFLEGLRKEHIEKYGLKGIEAMQNQLYRLRRKASTDSNKGKRERLYDKIRREGKKISRAPLRVCIREVAAPDSCLL